MNKNRQFELLYLLLKRGQCTAGELSQRLGVSERTIYRDIDALSAAGVPVYATQGKGGGIALMEHYVLDRTALTEQEQSQLLTALQSLSGSARVEAEATIVKLSALFRRQEADWLQVDLSRWGSTADDQDKFDRLKNAIWARHIVTFTYVSSYGQTSQRQVFPVRLVFKGQAWYLQAWCTEKSDYRTFRISRILDLNVLKSRFDPPPPPPSVESVEPPEEFCVNVRLRFAPWMTYRVYDEFHENTVIRGEDGTLTVEATFPEDQWLYGYLLSFGAAVEILEPAHVRQRLALLAREIWRQHGEPDKGCQLFDDMIELSHWKEGSKMDQIFCQSCSMPLTQPDQHGTEQDGSPSPHYCKDCYQQGAFTWPGATMEEMIDFCVPFMVKSHPELTEEQARAQMHKFFPMLLRWKK